MNKVSNYTKVIFANILYACPSAYTQYLFLNGCAYILIFFKKIKNAKISCATFSNNR
jgi:hypothetical protein